MVLSSAGKAFNGLFDPRSRSIVLKSLGLTILLFFGLWLGIQALVDTFILPFFSGWVWVTTLLLWVLGAGVLIAAGFVLAPTTAVFAGLFLDEVAENVETSHYPQDEPGSAMPLGASITLALQFGVLVLLANFFALMLVWLAGFGVIIFFIMNGYLIGREYFLFASMRFRPELEAKAMMKKYSLEIFFSGLIIAGFMSIPIMNLFTPVFAASIMVHLHKDLSNKLPVS